MTHVYYLSVDGRTWQRIRRYDYEQLWASMTLTPADACWTGTRLACVEFYRAKEQS